MKTGMEAYAARAKSRQELVRFLWIRFLLGLIVIELAGVLALMFVTGG